jgi:hypothetical protein
LYSSDRLFGQLHPADSDAGAIVIQYALYQLLHSLSRLDLNTSRIARSVTSFTVLQGCCVSKRDFYIAASRQARQRSADEMPTSRPLIARVLSVPAPTLLFKNSWDAEDCPRAECGST